MGRSRKVIYDPDAALKVESAGDEMGARFSYDGLDRVIHEKARLGILTSLSAHPNGLLFNDLKELCGLTDGNLNRHLAVLIDNSFIEVWRSASGQSRSQSLYRLTELGRQRFTEYVDVLEQVVRDAANVRELASAETRKLRFGWSSG